MNARATLSRTVARIVMSAMLCFGFWQFGQGAYIPAKGWLAQELMQRAWQKAEPGNDAPPPWPWADTRPVARLRALGGDVELIILEGGSGRTLAFGPGHLSISVLPGETGNSIIAGHRDTHFQFLRKLRGGDAIEIERAGGRLYRYEVVSIDVVDSRRGSIVLDTDYAILSLVTCYPFDALEPGGPMRYVVTAALVR